MDKVIEIYLPRWASLLYGLLAIILVPWILILAEFLPTKHLDTHWDALWVGFDSLMFFTLIITIYFMLRRKIWVIMSATALATLFIIDAWFDILTSKPGRDQYQALLLGVVEVILALLTYRLVYHVLHHSTRDKNFKVIIKS